MRIDGSCGIVTGAASGLGRATARRLASGGARLILLDLDPVGLERLRAELPGEHRAALVDVRDPVGLAERMDAAAALGPLRFAVNCAGVPSAARILSRGVAHDLELWERIVGVNLTGTFNVLRLAAERIARAEPDADGERGVIVNTASVAAFDGLKGQAAYAASKAAVAGMTLPIARDLADHLIRCVSVAPGVFETALTANVPEKGMEAMRRCLLNPARAGRPDEFAALVASILANPYLNGTCIRLDGGTRLAP